LDNDDHRRDAAGEAGPVRVLIVDDQEPFRAALRDLVTATEGLQLVGEASTGEEALELAAQLAPEFVIMDKRMPGMGGPAATRALVDRDPSVVVLLVSVEPPDDGLARASGATGFVQKQRLSRQVLRDVWAAAGGRGPAATTADRAKSRPGSTP
jgi:DNA-binding NarL/FixJ family response regulator